MQPKYRYLLSLLFLFFYALHAVAQGDAVLKLSGVVRDEKNRPVALASVKINNSTIGTITNSDGGFSLQIPQNLRDHFLMISYIGYQSARVAVNKHLDNKTIEISLVKSTGQLKEVVITAESAAGIVAHAYRNISQNYPQTNTFYTGFYRESNFSSRGNIERYNYVIEAVIKMNKPSYQKPDPEGDIKIEQSRRRDFALTDSVPHWYAGGYTPIRFDVAKKRFDFIDPGHLKRYIYKKEDITTYYDEPVYVISFTPRGSAGYKGILYIDMQTYAIVKVDYQLSTSGLKDYNLLSTVTLSNREFKTNYQPVGNKWYLQSIWQQAMGSSKRSGPFRYTTEYATTRIDTAYHEDFEYGDRLQFDEILSAKTLSFNKDFWDNYNIVSETQQLKDLLIDTAVKVAAQPIKANNDTLAKQPVMVGKTIVKKRTYGQHRIMPVYTLSSLSSIHTTANSMAISYMNPAGHKLIDQSIAVKPGDLAVGYGIGYDFSILENLSLQFNLDAGWGHVSDVMDNLGFIYRFRLTSPKKRPVKLLLGLNYSFITISKNLDKIPAGMPVTIDGRNFDNAIGVELFSKQQMLNPQLGFSLEINKLLSFFVQGGYYIPVSQNDGLQFTDKPKGFFKSLFPAHRDVPLNSRDVSLSVDGQAADKLPYRNNFTVSTGLVGFIRFRK